MVDSNNITKLDDVKHFLTITDDIDNTILNELITDADADIKDELTPFADSFPLDEDNLRLARKAGVFHVVSSWKDRLNNEKAAVRFEKKYKSKMSTLKDALRATPTTRTKIVASSVNYDTEENQLFSQRTFF